MPASLGRPEVLGSQSSKTGSSEVVERALDVLLCFLDSDGELGVTEISRRLGIEKGRVHRFLQSFKSRGFIADNPRTHRYSIGFRAAELYHAMTRQFDVIAEAQPFMRRLRALTGETVSLAVRVGDHRVALTQVESEHEIRQTVPVGRPLTLRAGAAGKVLLAFLPEQELISLVRAPFEFLTDATITDPDRLVAELRKVRERGYAESCGERMLGSRSTSAPVWTWRGDLMALSVSGPSFRYTKDLAELTAEALVEATRSLTHQLGGDAFAMGGVQNRPVGGAESR